MKQLDLNLLVALDALLSTCSVTEAAQRMHLSTPAMSHTLARIRDMLGDPILVRAGRKLVPTPRALALAQPVSQLLAQASALVANDTAASLKGLKRSFVIRAPEGVSVVFGAPLSLAMQARMPAATVQFVSEGLGDNTALRDGRIDLDIGAIRHEDPEVETELLTQQTLVGAARTGHPLLAGKLNARRFAAARHVGVTLRNRELSPVDEALALAGLERFIAMTVHSSYGALVVAARSDLVASVPEVMARAMQAVLRLEVFNLPLRVNKVPVVLAWHPRYRVDPAHLALRDCVRRVLSDPNWQTPANDLHRRA
jgi:DNA-binding transcriptional LysR family regulator